MNKLASIQKKIDAYAKSNALNKQLLGHSFHRCASDRPIDELRRFIEFANTNEVLGGLHDRRCVLSPGEFLQLFVPEQATPKNIEIIQGGLPGIFENIWESPDFDEFCEERDYEPTPCVDLRILRPILEIADAACVHPDAVMQRELDLQKPESITIICVKKSDNALSREYASYLTDACSGLDDQECMFALLRALTKQGK